MTENNHEFSRPVRVGIGGPVGSGKTMLTLRLCESLRDDFRMVAITNDIYTLEDAEFLARQNALPEDRIMGVETGGCPHTAIRDDTSMNAAAIEQLLVLHPDTQLVLLESGGDNLSATFSPELVDAFIYVIDVAEGDKIQILSDILGTEDHLGDMDFKLCGTEDGITACQMDIKIDGLAMSTMRDALEQAKAGRLHILGEMAKTIAEPREDISPSAPRLIQVVIDQDFIGAIIGPGGKIIKGIQAESGAEINIEDDGTVHIYAAKAESLECAKKMIEDMFAEVEIGTIYTGKIVNTMAFGAFMEVLPGKDGLVHISELAEGRVEKTEDVVKTGDVVTAKCIGVDEKGRVKMSMRAAIREARGESDDSDERGGDRGRRGGGGGGGGRRGGDGRDRDRGGDRGGRDRNRDKPKDDVPPPEKEESFSLTDD